MTWSEERLGDLKYEAVSWDFFFFYGDRKRKLLIRVFKKYIGGTLSHTKMVEICYRPSGLSDDMVSPVTGGKLGFG